MVGVQTNAAKRVPTFVFGSSGRTTLGVFDTGFKLAATPRLEAITVCSG